MKDISRSLLLENGLETGEVFLDILTDQAMADIPVIGTAYRILRSADNIRDRILMIKLARLLSPLHHSRTDRSTFHEKISSDMAEAQRVGEVLFLVLDKLSDLDRPYVLGCVFVSYLKGEVSGADLRRIAHAIDSSYSDDLMELLRCNDLSGSVDSAWSCSLASTGLTTATGGKTWENVGSISYLLTDLGKKLHAAYHGGNETG
jgi:hypothetical protein